MSFSMAITGSVLGLKRKTWAFMLEPFPPDFYLVTLNILLTAQHALLYALQMRGKATGSFKGLRRHLQTRPVQLHTQSVRVIESKTARDWSRYKLKRSEADRRAYHCCCEINLNSLTLSASFSTLSVRVELPSCRRTDRGEKRLVQNLLRLSIALFILPSAS